MGDLSVIFFIYKEKIKLKNHQIKSNHTVLRKNEVAIHGPQVLAPDNSSTGLAAKICTSSNEH
jgi:hypothetical protein